MILFSQKKAEHIAPLLNLIELVLFHQNLSHLTIFISTKSDNV